MEISAVKPPIAYQHQLTPYRTRAVRNQNARLLFVERLEPSRYVSERPDFFLKPPIHKFYRAGVQTCARELSKVCAFTVIAFSVFDMRQINETLVPTTQHLPCRFRFCGDSQLAREDIDRAERQYTNAREFETLRHIAQTVQHFVYCAVTARRDDGVKPFLHGSCCEFARITRSRGFF